MEKIFKNTALISCLTLVSRVLGLVRDVMIAMVFGTSVFSDAFFVVFRPFDLCRKLFSEGILSISFVPVFSKTLAKSGKSSAMNMAFSFAFYLSVLSVCVILFCLYFTPFIISLIVPGFSGSGYIDLLTVVLFKIMLPYLWFIMMIAVCMGVLNSFGNFGIPAATPLVFNVVMITCCFIASRQPDPPVTALAAGVTIGGFIQLVIQIPSLLRIKGLASHRFNVLNSDAIAVLKIMVPCMVGAASYQVNVMVASFCASILPTGGVSSFYYADRLLQFPLALFVVSTMTVFLPDLSGKVAQKDFFEIGFLFSKGVRMVFFVTIPAMFGLMALHQEIVTLLFARGAFDSDAVLETGKCLFFLVIGLWAFSGVRLLITLYNALGRIWIPFYAAVFSIGLNFGLCVFLMPVIGLAGLALSVSISGVAGFIILLFCIPASVNIYPFKMMVSACRSVFYSVIMYLLVRMTAFFVIVENSGSTALGLGTLVCILSGVITYFTISYLFSAPELRWVSTALNRK